jgi:hypothetical protein
MSNHRAIRLQSDNTIVVVKGHIRLNRDKQTFRGSLIKSHIKGSGITLVLDYDHNSTLGSLCGRKSGNPRGVYRDIVMNKLSKERGRKGNIGH